MAIHTELSVTPVAVSSFTPPQDGEWRPDTDGPEGLVEFAGRACYETFDRPNPRTATTPSYIRHIIQVGHTALLEHPHATLYIRGISRSCTHELVRHRMFSFSQLSQRFVHHDGAAAVIPEAIADRPELVEIFDRAVDSARQSYEQLLDALEHDRGGHPNALLQRKQARQAARAVLPNATESRIVMTGNFRAWRQFIAYRATEHADDEMRAVAVACLDVLRHECPAVFADFEITELDDGTVMASSPLVYGS